MVESILQSPSRPLRISRERAGSTIPSRQRFDGAAVAWGSWAHIENFWAGRTYANLQSARLAKAA